MPIFCQVSCSRIEVGHDDLPNKERRGICGQHPTFTNKALWGICGQHFLAHTCSVLADSIAYPSSTGIPTGFSTPPPHHHHQQSLEVGD